MSTVNPEHALLAARFDVMADGHECRARLLRRGGYGREARFHKGQAEVLRADAARLRARIAKWSAL